MRAQAVNVLLRKDLEEKAKRTELAESDLHAMRATAEWSNTFVAG